MVIVQEPVNLGVNGRPVKLYIFSEMYYSIPSIETTTWQSSALQIKFCTSSVFSYVIFGRRFKIKKLLKKIVKLGTNFLFDVITFF